MQYHPSNSQTYLSKMLMCVILWTVASGFLLVGSLAEKMLGEGKWTVLNVQRCENDDEMPWKLDVKRHRLNRTHDAFDADMQLLEDLDDSCAIRLEVCKVMDGGCKPWTTLTDDCLPTFVKKYAEENVRVALTSAGIEKGDFPIPKGEHHIDNYMVKYDDLPKDGVYGEFGVDAYMVKDGKDMACCHGSVEYTPKDDYDSNPKTFG